MQYNEINYSLVVYVQKIYLIILIMGLLHNIFKIQKYLDNNYKYISKYFTYLKF